ncbi:Bax inhibitor-1/YccA family protein [Streptomyces sp. NPDC005141]
MKSSNPVLKQWEKRNSAPKGDGESVAGFFAERDAPDTSVLSLRKEVPPQTAGNAMTLDDVISRTALTLGVAVLAAVLSWALLPVDSDSIGRSYGIATGAALVALVLALIQAFRTKPVPAVILAYAAFEGIFLGVVSSIASSYVSPGVVIQAVAGTMAVFAGVLIAYKLHWIRVTRRFYGFVMAATIGYLILLAGNLLFSLFNGDDGLGARSGGLGVLFGVIGIVIGACFLALHFKQVEDGVANGAPREESWLAAFGLVITLVWIYVEMLNLLTLIREDDIY